MAQLTITRHKATAQYFTEDLGNNIGLDMVLIPGGTFLMGSPKDELERRAPARGHGTHLLHGQVPHYPGPVASSGPVRAGKSKARP